MSVATTTGSMLPTPPSSPCTSPRKLVALPTELPPHLKKDVAVLAQRQSTPVVDATSIADARSTGHSNAAQTPKRTLATLKRDLHINDDWKCGALTLRNTNCKRRIRHDKKDLIEALLQSMTGLTRACPDLEPALLKLVKLTHCDQHDAGLPVERRLEAWVLTFPCTGPDGRVYQVPVELLIRRALKQSTARCIAHVNGAACEEKVGGWKVQNQERTVQELIKQEIYSNNVQLEFLLKVLEWNRTCQIHQNLAQPICVTAWKRSIEAALLSLAGPLEDHASIAGAPNEPETSKKYKPGDPRVTTLVDTEKSEALSVQVLASLRTALTPTFRPEADVSMYWPKAYDSSPFEIIPHSISGIRSSHSNQLLRTTVDRALDTHDRPSGYVYAYDVEGNEGYVKIGYTSRSVEERHQEWTFDCNRQTKPIYPHAPQTRPTTPTAEKAPAAPVVLVPHARRVEALCHAELDQHRVRIYCKACLKQHIEWFKVSAVNATAVIQKWSRWMATHPYYASRQLKNRPIWTLKESEENRLSNFDQFMRDIAKVPKLL